MPTWWGYSPTKSAPMTGGLDEQDRYAAFIRPVAAGFAAAWTGPGGYFFRRAARTGHRAPGRSESTGPGSHRRQPRAGRYPRWRTPPRPGRPGTNGEAKPGPSRLRR